ncbi:thioredoxin-like protein [Gloeophyllum trabeum ATCC 11539]|uniref:Thioredoxin-like protein n=1 Tax=Gloeophyllum trabeum (strain ATCC 11539 / FP-39264 / Madison 617) TaxID=670483 RepID=S7Q1V1_GLOTA|nr:thioredoxin-like protein [Gloeophyllum trabeum ATCC 11539]EPQ53503.1 thioredoxin-like protein [Gloeophyllum trabeum ATCC 11539]
MSTAKDTGKHYRTECTGLALETVKQHSEPADITFYGACFCPFVQRAWVALEYLGIPYRYYEVDPYKKPQELLEVSPKGLVPGLKLHTFHPPRGLSESTVIMEYLEDLAANTTKHALLPPITDSYARALIRLQSDHINRTLVPAFYRFLQAQDPDSQISAGQEFHAALEDLAAHFGRAECEGVSAALGLWREDGDLSWTDVMAGPWLFRASNVLAHYRFFTLPEGLKFRAYLDRLFNHPVFKRTCSTEDLYLDSYERYAWNRPNTSQVANAINSGRGLP